MINLNIGASSTSKGETLLDTIDNLVAMNADMFVVRHAQSGAPHLIAAHLNRTGRAHVHVVNAGDGRHAHPTQGLLDLFTIRHYKKDFRRLTVAVVGDVLHSRVARSLIHGLTTLGTPEVRVIGLKQDVAQAERKVARIKEEGGTPLAVEQAQLEVKKIADKIATASIIAPFDGEVLALNIRPGNSLEAFKTAIVAGDPSVLEITADLEASDVAELSVDMPAIIRMRNRPEQDLAGLVRQLPFIGGRDATVNGDDKAVHVALKNKNVKLELGELATVIITLEQKDQALWLQPAAIRTFQGRDFVVIQDGSAQRRVDVKLGIKGEDRVEVLEGVQEGQVVVGQ